MLYECEQRMSLFQLHNRSHYLIGCEPYKHVSISKGER